MTFDPPSDFSEVVRDHHQEALGYILASSGECLGIRREEIEVVNRNLRALDPEDLSGLDPEEPWFLGVLLCPGDGTQEVASFVADQPPEDRHRVHFYVHPDVDLVDAFRSWYAAGLADPATSEVEDFPTFHTRFGRHFNLQVYEDFR